MPQECGLIAADPEPNFAIREILYISPSNDTPGLHRIAIQKHSLIEPNEQAAIYELSVGLAGIKTFVSEQQLQIMNEI